MEVRAGQEWGRVVLGSQGSLDIWLQVLLLGCWKCRQDPCLQISDISSLDSQTKQELFMGG